MAKAPRTEDKTPRVKLQDLLARRRQGSLTKWLAENPACAKSRDELLAACAELTCVPPSESEVKAAMPKRNAFVKPAVADVEPVVEQPKPRMRQKKNEDLG